MGGGKGICHREEESCTSTPLSCLARIWFNQWSSVDDEYYENWITFLVWHVLHVPSGNPDLISTNHTCAAKLDMFIKRYLNHRGLWQTKIKFLFGDTIPAARTTLPLPHTHLSSQHFCFRISFLHTIVDKLLYSLESFFSTNRSFPIIEIIIFHSWI